MRGRVLGVAIALGAASWTGVVAADEAYIATFPIVFSVASEGGAPVQDGAWIDAQVARAEALFAAHGVHLRRIARKTVGEDRAHMVTRADRDALASLADPGVINVFVVGTLKDVDEKDRFRFGVHWRPSTKPASRFIILASSAPATVLAHELGHYFGNGHSTVTNNIMSYSRTTDEAFLDDAQVRTLRATAQAVVQRKEVVPVSR